MIIRGKKGEYEVGDPVASNYRCRTYRCQDDSMLVQVAKTPEQNGILSRGAWVLTKLAENADNIEAEYKKAGNKDNLNYHLGFPALHDSFVANSKQVNVLKFRHVDSVSSMIPLIKIWKENLRVDLRTSAWILGKLLKTLAFAHDYGMEVRNLTGNNILIEPEQHYVVIFDWSLVVHDSKIKPTVSRKEVREVADTVIKVLGGDLSRARECKPDKLLTDYIQKLAKTGRTAKQAHKEFYDIVDSLCSQPGTNWKSGFYKFNTLQIQEI